MKLGRKPLINVVHGITVTAHYPKSDTKMYGDYYDISINVACGDKMLSAEYGDQYHDKGWEKAEGFIDAFKLIFGDKLPVLKLRAADREDY